MYFLGRTPITILSFQLSSVMSTQRDKTVLNLILNPLLPAGDFQSSVIAEEEGETDPIKDLPHREECQQHELKGIRLAEAQKLEEALVELNTAIDLCPQCPSP